MASSFRAVDARLQSDGYPRTTRAVELDAVGQGDVERVVSVHNEERCYMIYVSSLWPSMQVRRGLQSSIFTLSSSAYVVLGKARDKSAVFTH